MAIFFCETSPLSRSHKRSAIAASAYRTGSRLVDVDGRVWNYEKRQCVAYTEIITPEGELPVTDRQALWLMAEQKEGRRDSRTARQFEIALPAELPLDANIELARAFCRMLAEKYGIVAEFSIHTPHRGHKRQDDGKNPDPRNIHAHVMTTTRQYHGGALGEKSAIEWEDTRLKAEGLPTGRQQITAYREAWAAMVNAALTAHGEDDFIYAGRVNKRQQVLLNENLRTEARLAQIEAEINALEAEEAAEREAEQENTPPMKPKATTTKPVQSEPEPKGTATEAAEARPQRERFSIPIRKDPPAPKKRRTAARRALLELAHRWRERREMERRRREQCLRLRAGLAAERQKKKEQTKRALLSRQEAERWRPPTL